MNYLCSYKPLVLTRAGCEASATFGLPPYIDSSCRREPDFESQHPSISALCRRRMFAPRLQEGDVVAYITVKAPYAPEVASHWRLVAILRVRRRFETHA